MGSARGPVLAEISDVIWANNVSQFHSSSGSFKSPVSRHLPSRDKSRSSRAAYAPILVSLSSTLYVAAISTDILEGILMNL